MITWQDRLLFGMWWDPHEPKPPREWRKNPCAVLLPFDNQGPLVALDLYPDGHKKLAEGVWSGGWQVLSDAGSYTYAHSSGLRRGETWRFVTEKETYVVKGLSFIKFSDVAVRYGARDIAREDRLSVELRLRSK